MPPERKRSARVTFLVGAVLIGLLLWVVARRIDMTLFREALKSVNPALLLLAIGVATLTFPLRVPRWRLLLPEPEGRRLETRSLWHAIAIGFTANTLIGRLGELVRAGTIARLERLSFATAFASLAVERAVDGLVMVGLLGLGLVTTHLPPDVAVNGHAVGPMVTRAGLIALVATLLTLAAAWKPAATLSLVRRVTPKGRLGENFLVFTEHVLTGLGALRDPARAFPVLGWSILIWTINSVAFWIGCLAFGIEIPFTASFVLNGMVVVGLVVSPTPGGIGGFELALVGTLALFKVNSSVATAFALAFHLTTAIPILLLGLWSLRQVGGSLTRVPEAAAEQGLAAP